MLCKNDLLDLIDGKTDEEVKTILKKNYNLSWNTTDENCHSWHARVFTYCHTAQLQAQLEVFFWLINYFSPRFHVCFRPEETVYLGRLHPSRKKQIVLYYSLSLV